MSIPSSRFGAERLLQGRCLHRRKVANNTYVERHPSTDGDTFALRLHATDVVRWLPNGDTVLSTGGWYTVTTKARINDALPGGWRLWSQRGRWMLSTGPWDNPVSFRFQDGITLHEDGTVSGEVPRTVQETEDAANAQMRKAVAAFVRSIKPEDIVRQFDDSAGDCFLCRFGDTGCLAEHVAERYFHLTLARRAIEARGYRSPDTILGMIYHDAKRGQVDTLLTDNLRKYLRKNLTTGAVAAK